MNYIKTSEHFPSCSEKGENACYFWLPASGNLRAIVQLAHGMCEYAERYEHLAEVLCQKDIALISHDHPGHGRSAAAAEDLGFIDETNGADLLTEDFRKMHLIIRERFPDTPVFLLGHSMGSFVVRDYLSRWSDGLSGAVICGTAGPNPAAKIGILLAKAIIRLKGSRHRSKLLSSISTGAYGKAFPGDPAGQNAWISRDSELTARYAADPFCNYLFTAAGYRDLFTLLARVSEPDWAASLPKELPLYLIAGEQDPVGDMGKGVRVVADRLHKAGIRDLTLRLYADDRHEIFNELDKDRVFSDLLCWLEERLPAEKV
ncbi:MAG: alpha/beta fold hydrolase [Oscillospiraceae bacterium]|nr:alpha/beta fold hydrolase [Oscillospiraceae bacterium]